MSVIAPKFTTARPGAGRAQLDLHIDELVLHGFRHTDRYEIAAAVERELARLFREESPPAPWLDRAAGAGGAAVYRLDAGGFDVPHDATPDAVGVQVAQAIHRGLVAGPVAGRQGAGRVSQLPASKAQGER